MIKRYSVTIDGRTRAVEIEDVGHTTRVIVDGREKLLDARSLGDGIWSLVDGRDARLLQIDGAPAKMTVEISHPDGEPRLCAAEVSEAGPAAAVVRNQTGNAAPWILRATIPGRLVKVLVKTGERVAMGQALLVLEAMKMENELHAPREGVVVAVHATEGIAVEAGQDLVSLSLNR
jgi:biotin carboxyl carrier protein